MIILSRDDEHIELTGHAGYDHNGRDIVCAGVTALVQELVESVKLLTDDEPDHVLTEGHFKMRTKGLSDKSMMLVDSFLIGIRLIIDEFPDYVTER